MSELDHKSSIYRFPMALSVFFSNLVRVSSWPFFMSASAVAKTVSLVQPCRSKREKVKGRYYPSGTIVREEDLVSLLRYF